ncbi:MAG: hypothetical protein K9H25_17245 [Rhodospirillum sp.]|nr:hypothetical protein [Rhodospirillum sp.]MCF8503221.1 hypothetical protein [Rhodospirillum sp.]
MTRISNTENTWRSRPVDPRIKPLVDAMNATGRIQTIASCEGHWNRYSTPYVYFHCSTKTASEIHSNLNNLRDTQCLTYYWGIVGLFNEDAKLCFRIQAGELEPPLGLGRTLWHFLFKRTQIDADLQALTFLFSHSLQHAEDRIIHSCPPEVERSTDKTNKTKEHISSILSLYLSNWVFCVAAGARTIRIRSQRCGTNTTRKKSRQGFHSNQRKGRQTLSEILNESKEARP